MAASSTLTQPAQLARTLTRGIIALLLLTFVLCPTASAKRWKLLNGKSVSGTYKRCRGVLVQLQSSGRTAFVPYHRLVEKDKAFVQQRLQNDGNQTKLDELKQPERTARDWVDSHLQVQFYGRFHEIIPLTSKIRLEIDSEIHEVSFEYLSPRDKAHVLARAMESGQYDELTELASSMADERYEKDRSRAEAMQRGPGSHRVGDSHKYGQVPIGFGNRSIKVVQATVDGKYVEEADAKLLMKDMKLNGNGLIGFETSNDSINRREPGIAPPLPETNNLGEDGIEYGLEDSRTIHIEPEDMTPEELEKVTNPPAKSLFNDAPAPEAPELLEHTEIEAPQRSFFYRYRVAIAAVMALLVGGTLLGGYLSTSKQ